MLLINPPGATICRVTVVMSLISPQGRGARVRLFVAVNKREKPISYCDSVRRVNMTHMAVSSAVIRTSRFVEKTLKNNAGFEGLRYKLKALERLQLLQDNVSRIRSTKDIVLRDVNTSVPIS